MKNTAYFLSLFFFIFLITQCSHAIELTDLSIEYNHSISTNRDWLLPRDSARRGELNLNMAVRTSELTYTELEVHSTIDQSQFRHVGLEVESGLRAGQYNFYVQHHSQHILDAGSDRKFPNVNSIGVRVRLK